MNRTRSFFVGFVALILSGVVTWVVYQGLKTHFETAADAQSIVVATQKLSMGQRIEASDVTLVQWPADLELVGAFRSIDDVVGRGVLVPVWKNEPLVQEKLAAVGAGAGLTTAIPDGMRAVSVKVDEIVGVAGFVLPGSRVDVILSGSPEEGGRNRIEMARVILENIEVLAAGQNVERDANGKAQKVQVITLLVTPEDAQALALAQNDGKIQLALRNPLDLEKTQPASVHKSALYDRTAPKEAPKTNVRRAPRPEPQIKTEPVPPPPPTVTVELIQGGKRENLNFVKDEEKKPPL